MDIFTTSLPLAELPVGMKDVYFILRGFGMVMIILAGLWIATELIGRAFIALSGERKPKAKRAKKHAPKVIPAKSLDPNHPHAPYVFAAAMAYSRKSIDPRLIALIAAAAHEELGEPVEIISVRGIDPRTGWAQEGRRQHFGSHRLR